MLSISAEYKRLALVGSLLATCCWIVLPDAQAFTTNNWINSSGGTWETTTSWSQGSVPDFDDYVRINTAGIYTVTVGNSAADTVPESFTNTQIDVVSTSGRPTLDFTYTNAINFLLTTNGSGLRIGNATVNWNAPNGILSIGGILSMNRDAGFGTSGVLNILSGRVNAVRPIIGVLPGANSIINIYTGGVFAFNSSDSRFGQAGALGQVNILGGTMVWSNQAFLGINATSTGRVVLAGGLLTVPQGSMELGSGFGQSSQQGYGQLIISNGLLLSSAVISVGAGPLGRGELFMYGGTVTNTGTFNVGLGTTSNTNLVPGSATGTVVIAGGSWIDNSLSWRVGAVSNSLGVIHLSNGVVQIGTTGARRIDLGFGEYGQGELNLAGGSLVLNTNSFLNLGVATNSAGILRVTGGTLSAHAAANTNIASIIVGSNDVATGRMTLEGGLVQLKTITVGSSGILSNRTGGVLQFLGVDHVLGAGSKIVDGGTLSYKNYSNLNVSTAAGKFSIVSGSILELVSSTNANITGIYSLADSAGNFKELSLTGTNTKWNSDALLIAAGTRLRVTNAVAARTSATITNHGTILVENSTMTYEKKVVIHGRYVSDPSTNTFNDDVTVSLSGTLEGGMGDLFDFKKNLIINSTNTHGFDVFSSTVSFSGGINHTNAIRGEDAGTNGLGHVVNFGYGSLRLGSVTDQVYFDSGNAAPSNALYVYLLDVPGLTDAAKLSIATNNLHTLTPNINVYYAVSNLIAANSYLQDLTYELPGGGFLIPATVPEPSTLALLFAAAMLFLRRGNRHE